VGWSALAVDTGLVTASTTASTASINDDESPGVLLLPSLLPPLVVLVPVADIMAEASGLELPDGCVMTAEAQATKRYTRMDPKTKRSVLIGP
jgi:hypothetical protein